MTVNAQERASGANGGTAASRKAGHFAVRKFTQQCGLPRTPLPRPLREDRESELRAFGVYCVVTSTKSFGRFLVSQFSQQNQFLRRPAAVEGFRFRNGGNSL